MLSIVLVPLSVAGMGWYWTQWQQSVNDLKSMIELVTDKSPEKQKYGIAMFEYLAKNGKVPVEFLAAQIDYATSAENHELLPMLEVAIQAPPRSIRSRRRLPGRTSRRPSRVFIHVPNDEIYACLVRLRDGFKDGDKASIVSRPCASSRATPTPTRSCASSTRRKAARQADRWPVRHSGSRARGEGHVGDSWSRTNAPNSYELWFSGNPLPRICQRAAESG